MQFLWTKHYARLRLTKSTPGRYNWLFLAGGPGLGSESLEPLVTKLTLPGNMWYLDLPGDGSNINQGIDFNFSNWSKGLIEAIGALSNVVLVGHSTGGMFIQACANLKGMLAGLILMDSAPDASWQNHFTKIVQKHPIESLIALQDTYTNSPSNDLLKEMTLLSKPYLFTQEGLKQDTSFLNKLPYNFESCNWAAANFDSNYRATWLPDNIPTLIFAGEKDLITPIELFISKNEYHRASIKITTVPNAGHFTWIEQPTEVSALFNSYYENLKKAE